MTQDSMPSPSTPKKQRRPLRAVFGAGGWFRRLARLWGFLAFAVLVVVLAREVILPFVFALLIAYILAPLVARMSTRADGTQRMHRAIAILICYAVFLTSLAGFFVLLLPRLSTDAARIGRELPSLYEKLNHEWAPAVGAWVREQFPALNSADDAVLSEVAPTPISGGEPGAVVMLPPDTAFVLAPLPDGRMAVTLPPGGVALDPGPSGGFVIRTGEAPVEELDVEARLREWTAELALSLQARLGDVVRIGQSFVAGFIRSVFTFFLVLMVAAFILLDLEKLHGFVRGLIPGGSRGDYDIIVAGMNRSLAGVIRGQLMICVVNGILTYIGLVIFGVKYSLILGMVAAVMSLIPIFGSILSTIPIVVAALVSGDQGLDIARAVAAVGWIVGIHFIEANMLNPKIIGTAAKIHPVLVIFALILGEHSYGLVGALLAVPVAAMIQVLFLFFRRKAWLHERGDADPGTGEDAPGVGEDAPGAGEGVASAAEDDSPPALD